MVHLIGMAGIRPNGAMRGLAILLFACFSALACTTGCGKDRTQDIMGRWNWGGYSVHFESDGTWGASDRKLPNFEKFAGSWNLSGDELSIGFSGASPPGDSDATFTLSGDGRKLVAKTGAAGTMVKL